MDTLPVCIAELDHVVCLLTENMDMVVERCLLVRVLAVLILKLLDSRLIHLSGVCHDRADDIVLCQLIVFSHLDGAEHICNTGNAEVAKKIYKCRIHALLFQIIAADRLVEEAEELLGIFIIDVDDQVCILYIVDPRNMLVADALDAVRAEAVVEQGRALESFADTDLGCRIQILDAVAGCHRSGGT